MPQKLSESSAWKKLEQHRQNIANTSLTELFESSSLRHTQFALNAAGLHLDYSKNLINQETLSLFEQLASQQRFNDARASLKNGAKVNKSEGRPALHTALRDTSDQPFYVNKHDIRKDIRDTQQQMTQFVNQIHKGKLLGGTGKVIRDVVNIGIGGSYLGPKMVTQALKPYWHKAVNCHFLANIDGSTLHTALENLDPETTLFIVASKSFSTLETQKNAIAAREWLYQVPALKSATDKHFIAISSNISKAVEFGIAEKNIFPMWDWVGGRYSLWSAIGLPIAIAVGMDNFRALLDGAHSMDEHFFTAPASKNMPFIMGMLQIWYSNFFGAQSQAVIPYDHSLRFLPEHLQQLEMESCGKSVTKEGLPINWRTGCSIWGGAGTNGQHAYHQLLHQGTEFIPVDFIFPLESHYPVNDHHAQLIANCLSQSRALMTGKSLEQAMIELKREGKDYDAAKQIAPHKVIPGNRPSNTLVLEKVTPFSVGALIALYEHKVFSQSVILDINAFDQWGVELGKQMSSEIYQALSIPVPQESSPYDTSTADLIQRFRDANV